MPTWFTSEDFSAGTNLPVVSPSEASSVQRGNRKLKRLSIDDEVKNNLRRSINFDSTSVPPIISGDLSAGCEKTGNFMSLRRLYDGKSRFPRIENMPHFHYDDIDLGSPLQVSLIKSSSNSGKPSVDGFIVHVTCKEKTWNIRRNVENFTGLDRQIHRCLFDRKISQLPCLVDVLDDQQTTSDAENILDEYLSRLSEIADNANFNCGPVLNWFELDNHGNHLLLTDESAINVPAVAAAHVIKRYTSQGGDEISLEVGDIISIIDMPPVDESIWWRGKLHYEVGFFPSQCVEVIGDMANNHPMPSGPGRTPMKPVAKKRGKLMSFLRLFLSSRPTRARLMQTGILKERTFGCDLGEHLAQTSRQVPLVLEACSSVIEEHGVIDGIYRLTGSTTTIQKIRLAFDSESPPDLNTEFYLRDVHCISALLKTYFRELPNPLLTYHLYDKFVASINITDDEQRKIAIHHVIQQLPPPHYRTLEYLLRHLSHIASFSGQTGMHAKNLAIVWAPNLLSPRNPDYGNTALLEINIQAILVEFLIRNTEELFDMNAASIAIVSNPRYNTLQERGPHHGLGTETDPVAPGTLGLRLASISVSPATKLISLEEARARACSVPNKPPPRAGSVPNKPPPRPPPPRSLDLKSSSETLTEETKSELREPYQSHTVGRLESGPGRSSKGAFGRAKSFTMTRSKNNDSGTFFFVSKENLRDDQLYSDVGEFEDKEPSRTKSADNLAIDSGPSQQVRYRNIKSEGKPIMPPTRKPVTAELVTITQKESPKPKHRYSLTSGASNVLSKASSSKRGSAPITSDVSRERFSSSVAQIRRHPVLTSFKKVTSDNSPYADSRESFSQRRASTGSHGDDSSRNSVTLEKRPASVYDNLHIHGSVSQRDPPTYRYSSPVFECKSIPEETRYSVPSDNRTPPLPRAHRGSGRNNRLAITGARLAQSSIL